MHTSRLNRIKAEKILSIVALFTENDAKVNLEKDIFLINPFSEVFYFVWSIIPSY